MWHYETGKVYEVSVFERLLTNFLDSSSNDRSGSWLKIILSWHWLVLLMITTSRLEDTWSTISRRRCLSRFRLCRTSHYDRSTLIMSRVPRHQRLIKSELRGNKSCVCLDVNKCERIDVWFVSLKVRRFVSQLTISRWFTFCRGGSRWISWWTWDHDAFICPLFSAGVAIASSWKIPSRFPSTSDSVSESAICESDTLVDETSVKSTTKFYPYKVVHN